MASLQLPSVPLVELLRKPLVDNARSRLYQEGLDRAVDTFKERWDFARGMLDARGIELPHEKRDDYWSLTDSERQKITSPEAEKVYRHNCGRHATAPLGLAAFCQYSPLSRHHGSPDLRRVFEAGLRTHVETMGQPERGDPVRCKNDGWSFGWDVEPLVYGMVFCRETMDPALYELAGERLSAAATRIALAAQDFTEVGSHGNQRCVHTLGLELLGQLLDVPAARRRAEEFWRDAMPRVLDESGQVMEQHGPCMHYSYTAFFYAWLNLAVRGDLSQMERVVRCLDWFRARHTESFYPIAGPSTRWYEETMSRAAADLWAAAEQVAHLDGSLREWVDRGVARARQTRGPLAVIGNGAAIRSGCGHGGAPTMWALLMVQDETSVAGHRRPWPRPFTRYYETMLLTRRSALKYALIRREYQTHFNFTDFMPFSGVQTWALGEEAPVVHPTPLVPSTTQAYGLDTARQGVSHNWGLFGCGAMAADGYLIAPEEAGRLAFVVARYDWLWRLVFFTDRSTVILEFGNGGPRRTLWTLNRVEPAEPEIRANVVSFAGRRACLHSSVETLPKLVSSPEHDPWAAGVRQLEYDCGAGPAAFAFSNDSFRFQSAPPPPGLKLCFSDDAGRYEVTLDERFLAPNPGNLRMDPYRLAHGTTARQLELP